MKLIHISLTSKAQSTGTVSSDWTMHKIT